MVLLISKSDLKTAGTDPPVTKHISSEKKETRFAIVIFRCEVILAVRNNKNLAVISSDK
jgi:hypothetical protein